MHNLYHKLEETTILTKVISIFGRKETPAQKLWREVYVVMLERGSSHITAADQADKAVDAFRDRQL